MKKILLAIIAVLSVSGVFAANTDIRLNSIGYRQYSLKKASIKAASTTSFYVVSEPAGVTVLSGTTTLFGANSDTGETIYFADFSSVTAAGTYYLDVPGTGRSFNFSIDDHVFDPAFYTVFRGYYLWRCGTDVTGTHYYNGVTNTYTHTLCHENDGWLDYVGGGHVKKTGTKGWHDAGDYNKYVTNANVTFGVLGKAWEYLKPNIESVAFNLPATPAAYPEYLRELKWETDWLFTMQAAGGRVYHKLSALDFSSDWSMPQDNDENRYYVPYSTAATADFVAMMAQAYRLFLPYDSTYANQCLYAARISYGRLTTSPDNVNVDANQAGFSTGGYGTSDEDDRVWAAAEMWETTGEAVFLTDFENRANSMGSKITGMDWGDVRNLGMFTYYRSARPGKSAALMNAIRTATLNAANNYVSTADSHGYARALGTQYWWGVNGALARTTFTLYMAHYMSPLEDYVNAANEVLNHIFGRNYFCRSMVTGLGYNAAMNPHDRRSANDGIAQPWPGYLVGGPKGNNSGDSVLASMPAGLPAALYWADHVDSYATNEIAINWNAGLVFALAWLKDAPVAPTPTITGTPPTVTVSPTITETHTVTPTMTITRTHTITPTPTITPTEIFDTLEINKHYTFPNPAKSGPITFRISNKGFIKEIMIKIFTYSGRKIGEVKAQNLNTSAQNDIPWLPAYDRLGNGIYFYTLEAQGIKTGAVKKTGTFAVIDMSQ